jgi:hypothetical protein
LWYVTFPSEEAALRAVDQLRLRTFAEKPIAARIKGEVIHYAYAFWNPFISPVCNV